MVYLLKDQAIRTEAVAGRATHRRVTYTAACGHCGGSTWHRRPGRREWGWDDCGEKCHTCAAEGTVTLRFVETALAAGIRADGSVVRWHSPAERGIGRELWEVLDDVPEPVTDWRPRQPGEERPAPEVAALLLEVERWLAPTWLVAPPLLFAYHLTLEEGVRVCCPRDNCWDDRARRGRVIFKVRMCRCCPRTPHPDFADARLLAWMRAHPGDGRLVVPQRRPSHDPTSPGAVRRALRAEGYANRTLKRMGLGELRRLAARAAECPF